MGHTLRRLNAAFYVNDPGSHDDGPEAFHDPRPDNKVGYAGFVFQRDEDDAACCARALADENDAGCLDAPAVGLTCRVSCGQYTAFLMQAPQEVHGMVLQGKTGRLIVLENMFRGRNLGQGNSGVAALFGKPCHSKQGQSVARRFAPHFPEGVAA